MITPSRKAQRKLDRVQLVGKFLDRGTPAVKFLLYRYRYAMAEFSSPLSLPMLLKASKKLVKEEAPKANSRR